MLQIVRGDTHSAEPGPDRLDPRRLSPANRRRLSAPGLRTFLAIADLWGLTEEERRLVLGLPARSTLGAVRALRADGHKVGLIRPITAWPFPFKAFEAVNPNVKGFITVEANATGQLVDDVALAAKKVLKPRNIPVYCLPAVYGVPSIHFIRQGYENIKAGGLKEVY